MTDTPILVIGSTGKTGRPIVQRLETLGQTVRHGSRSSSTPFDWADPTTWKPALEGVERVYVTFYPDLAVPGADRAIESLIELAAQAGVQRMVLLSGRGEPAAQACERILHDSAVPHTTVVRAAWFMQNFHEGPFAALVNSGDLTLPAAPDSVEPFVDVRDIAEVAVAALTGDGHSGKTYEVTGPRLVTWSEVAGELSRATGRTIRFTQIPADAFRAALTDEAGPEYAALVTELFEILMDGRNAHLSSGVQEALGRPATDFRDYADTIAATGAWKEGRSTMNQLVVYLVLTSAVSTALVGGILFAFSAFIMRALEQQPAANAVAAMQAINTTVFTPWVMIPYIGTAPLLIAITALLWTGTADSSPNHRLLVTIACVLYVVGCILVTGTRNVPMNEHLDTLAANSDEAAAYWPEYVLYWTRWNHLRSAACLLASGLLVWSMRS
jgi:uncharacterized protein YbjT (DUF2867 family)/uncharacterized membrane protein